MSGYAIFGIILLVVGIWMAFEIWRAPMIEETSNGDFKIIKPAKKFGDLFKRRK
jgi:hypothetical protein